MFNIWDILSSLQLPLYYMMLFLGALAAFIMLNVLMKKGGFSKFVKVRVRRSLFWAAVLATGCSTVANWFFHNGLDNFSVVNCLTKGGYSFMVWVLSFLGISALFLRLYKLDVHKCLDTVIPPLLFATFFARMGCVLGGCCKGFEIVISDLTFTFPIREIEAIFALVLSIVLCVKLKGKRLAFYLIAYPAFRFFAEFLRGDDRGSILGIKFLSPTQIISLAVIATVVTILVVKAVKKSKEKKALLSCSEQAEKAEEPKDNSPATESPEKASEEQSQKDADKEKKKYIPRPVDFNDPSIRTNPWRIILTILLVISLVIGSVFVYNPFRVEWIIDVSRTVRNELDFIFGEKGEENEIGESVSLRVIDASDKAPVNSSSEALAIVRSYDSWNTNTFEPFEEKELPNKNRLYTFVQTVNSVPVFGKAALLVADENGNPLYVIRDAAGDVYAKETGATPVMGGKTYKEMFAVGYSEASTTECYYATELGIISAKYVSLNDTAGREIGVVVDKASDTVLETVDGNGLFSHGARASGIIDSSENVIDYINDGNKAEIKEKSKDKAKALGIENSKKAVEAALCKAYVECDTEDGDFVSAIETANEIAESVPQLSEQLYGDIFVNTLKQNVSDDHDEKQTAKVEKKARKAFTSSGIKEAEDEKPVHIEVEERKNVLKNTIGSANDVDIIKLDTKENYRIEFEITSDIGVDILVCTADGTAILSTYTASEHEFVLYSQDGTSYVVKVQASAAQEVLWEEEADYKVTVSAEEEKEQVPSFVSTVLYEISGAFASSNVYPFAFMFYGPEAYTLEELAMISSLPAMENCTTTCSGCLGEETRTVDYVKEFMLGELLVIPDQTYELFVGPETVMELSCFRFIETENGALVKAKLNITDSDGTQLVGYSFLRLELIKEAETFNFIVDVADMIEFDHDTAVKFVNIGNMLFSNKYYITEINTTELMSEFGDTIDNISEENGMRALYDFWESKPGASSYSYLKVFDEKAALKAGYSKESVEEFAKYTVKHNIAYCERAYEDTQAKIRAAEMFKSGMLNGYQLYSFIDDPIGAIIDENTDNKFVKSLYRIGKIGWGVWTGDITDITEAVTDEAMGDFVEQGINDYASQLDKDIEVLKDQLEEIEKLKKEYQKELSDFKKKYFWEYSFGF